MENSTQSTELTPAEQEVWKREEEYWVLSQALDLDGIATLFSPNVIGWSALSKDPPLGKEGLIEEMGEVFDTVKPGTFKYTLTCYSVRVYENMADVFYLCQMSYHQKPDGKNVQLKVRILHNWLNLQTEPWQIISGMSGAPPQADPTEELLSFSQNDILRGSFIPLPHPKLLST